MEVAPFYFIHSFCVPVRTKTEATRGSNGAISQVLNECGYLDGRHPEQGYVEDAVSNESAQVESQEVKVETYNTEADANISHRGEAWLDPAQLGRAWPSSESRRAPFPFPVLPGLWVEGQRPEQEVDPANDLADDVQGAAVDDHEVDPGDTKTQDNVDTREKRTSLRQG